MTTRIISVILVAAAAAAGCSGTPAEAPGLKTPPPNTVGPAMTPPPDLGAKAAESTKDAKAGEEPAAPKRGSAKAGAVVSEKPIFTRRDTQVGTGSEAVKGKRVVVHYSGWLYDTTRPDNKGRMFDSSLSRGKPFDFVLGRGEVIPGWDEGFVGMRAGGKRTLIIPPEMGYGVDGAGGGIIPPNATLLFEVELLEVP
jgi:FKBP-type peptidyl-prolyl cis-trans isomerase FkpA